MARATAGRAFNNHLLPHGSSVQLLVPRHPTLLVVLAIPSAPRTHGVARIRARVILWPDTARVPGCRLGLSGIIGALRLTVPRPTPSLLHHVRHVLRVGRLDQVNQFCSLIMIEAQAPLLSRTVRVTSIAAIQVVETHSSLVAAVIVDQSKTQPISRLGLHLAFDLLRWHGINTQLCQ